MNDYLLPGSWSAILGYQLGALWLQKLRTARVKVRRGGDGRWLVVLDFGDQTTRTLCTFTEWSWAIDWATRLSAAIEQQTAYAG